MERPTVKKELSNGSCYFEYTALPRDVSFEVVIFLKIWQIKTTPVIKIEHD